MSAEITINKPSPIELGKQTEFFDGTQDVSEIIQKLESGNNVQVTGVYSNGIVLLKELQAHLKSQFPNNAFEEQRAYRAAFNKLSNLVIIEIRNHKLKVKKAPSIGWLEKLYPNNTHFYLTFPQVQGLNSSWQWYQKGITLPVLRNKIHPYYGTYFPTRFDHLILFDNWLKRYEGPKKGAFDIGIGSGVLAFQMVKHGFQKVFGTDTNPNAIVGLKEFMGETKLSRKVELDFNPFFGKWEKPSELIVFNPPWLPNSENIEGLDEAIYYRDSLFPDFFEEAKKRLLPDGKLVVLFSNLAQITKVSDTHPIEKELAEGGRFELEHCYTKSVKSASNKTKRDQHWRALEEVELWVLVHK